MPGCALHAPQSPIVVAKRRPGSFFDRGLPVAGVQSRSLCRVSENH
jgi:hypothetical protein